MTNYSLDKLCHMESIIRSRHASAHHHWGNGDSQAWVSWICSPVPKSLFSSRANRGAWEKKSMAENQKNLFPKTPQRSLTNFILQWTWHNIFLGFFKTMGFWGWFYLGLALVALEFFLPGLVVIFFGLSALTISLILYSGYEFNFLESFGIWSFLSFFYWIALRSIAVKLFFSKAQKAKILADEEEHLGKVVGTITEIWPDAEVGRIRYLGKTGRAKSLVKQFQRRQKQKFWDSKKISCAFSLNC